MSLTLYVCYTSVFLEPFRTEVFSSSLKLTKNVKIKIYRIVILLVVLYGCESWSLILREEYRLTVLENGVLRKKFGTRDTRQQVNGEDYIMRNL